MSGIRILINEFLPAGFISLVGTGVTYGISLVAGHPLNVQLSIAIYSGLTFTTWMLNLTQVIDRMEKALTEKETTL